MAVCIEADTADAIWQELGSLLAARRNAQASIRGATWELRPVILELTNPRNRWLATRTPAINPAAMLAEVVWIVCGREDAQFVNRWNPILPRYAGEGDCYYGAYGTRLRAMDGVDQLSRAADILSSAPDSRQVCLTLWDPARDLPYEDGEQRDLDIPCNIASLLKIRRDKLEWTQVSRSNDFFRGLPLNIVQFTTLQEIVAGWIGVDVGKYTHVTDSLHLYQTDAKCLDALGQFENAARNTDDLRLSRDESLSALGEIEKLAEEMAYRDLSVHELVGFLDRRSLPTSYMNLLSMLVADVARRNGDYDTAERALGVCTNPVLTNAFRKWDERQRARLDGI